MGLKPSMPPVKILTREALNERSWILPNLRYLIFVLLKTHNFQLYGDVTECMVSSYEDMRAQLLRTHFSKYLLNGRNIIITDLTLKNGIKIN